MATLEEGERMPDASGASDDYQYVDEPGAMPEHGAAEAGDAALEEQGQGG